MNWLFSPPSIDDLIRLLKAWRFWSVGALIGALLGAGLYYVAPPPYRAHAVVLVDFNLEQAWPEETDRQQFYYLERETRKLVEIAWSDEVRRTAPDDLPLRAGHVLGTGEAGEQRGVRGATGQRARDQALLGRRGQAPERRPYRSTDARP